MICKRVDLLLLHYLEEHRVGSVNNGKAKSIPANRSPLHSNRPNRPVSGMAADDELAQYLALRKKVAGAD